MIDKLKLAESIRHLNGLSNDERSALLELLNDHKKYGLVWEEKEEEVEKQLQEELPVLLEVPDKRILGARMSPSASTDSATAETCAPDFPNHILIEGDNLHALTCLSYTHEGAIDVIYIDPPYNTGNKDFVYNDRYVDSEDEFRHSKWLSFMAKRLRIARRLLSDKGVIFISIDDNEQAALKLLCDEVFGERNFVGMVSRATGTTTGQDTGSLGKACDYILIYSKYPNYQIGGIPLTEKDLGRYDMVDEKGAYSILQLRRTGGEDRREDRPTMFFPIIAPDGSEVYPYGPTGYESRWRVGPEKVKMMIKDNLLFFKKDSTGNWKVYYKFYAEGKTKRPSNLWTDIDGNKKAQIELKGTLGDVKFETPKPIQLVKQIAQLTTNESSTILDFFAGSGTTLHAVMQLNKEDGGHRQCILVTNNENSICENVTYERNRRVIQGYTNSKGEQVAGLTNNNLRYYRTGYVPRERTQRNMRALVNAATDLLCIQNNLYAEKDFTISGKKVRRDIARRFGASGARVAREMLIIYREEFAEEIAAEIAQMEMNGGKMKIYIFSPGRYAFDDTFEAVQDKVELVALPAAIYDAYKRVLPKRKEKTFEEQEQENIPTTLF